MEQDDMKKYNRNNGGSRFWSGLLLVAVGGLLMARQLGADIPNWIFSWHMLLIAIGLLISFKSGFKNAGGFIMIIVGCAFLLNDMIPNAHMRDFIWPGVLILAGFLFIVKPRSHFSHKRHWGRWPRNRFDMQSAAAPVYDADNDNAEFIEINAVFGGVKKIVLSKNFKGGEINSFMGGAEINLLQADIKQPVQIEINNVFGGTKLILPSNWDIRNEITAVFGGVEDKRNPNLPMPDPNKAIILKGTCVFGGIDIKNF